MTKPRSRVEALSNEGLLNATCELVREAHVEAELLVHLGEIDERKLYLARTFPSMFAFCCDELGFSEDAAYSRILVARAARRFPAVIEALRTGAVHLAGLRLLVPHLTIENHRDVLAKAAGKSKRAVEELIAQLSPKPPVPSSIRKLPERAAEPPAIAKTSSAPPAATTFALAAPFKIQFTAGRSFRDKLRQAQDLLRHRVPDGDMATILEMALDVLIERVQKERFAAGRGADVWARVHGQGVRRPEGAVNLSRDKL